MKNALRKMIGAQGEVNVFRITSLPINVATRPVDVQDGITIISHSESGNHHVLDGATVLERTGNVPAGMRILYAILEHPSELRQDTANPHKTIPLEAGIYEFRISREFNPFIEQARRVAD